LDPGHPTLDLLLLHRPTDFIDTGQNPSSTAGREFRDTLFNDPKSLASWFYDPEATRLLLEDTAIAA
ncbi:hypothetical protein, partial [Zoogloea sp.]|uniref:hypothetical protein n=1 Tax=Zoogloea sp. TaxID=49181 RepID=UPI0037D9D1F4